MIARLRQINALRLWRDFSRTNALDEVFSRASV
jgi:hypothetical protein